MQSDVSVWCINHCFINDTSLLGVGTLLSVKYSFISIRGHLFILTISCHSDMTPYYSRNSYIIYTKHSLFFIRISSAKQNNSVHRLSCEDGLFLLVMCIYQCAVRTAKLLSTLSSSRFIPHSTITIFFINVTIGDGEKYSKSTQFNSFVTTMTARDRRAMMLYVYQSTGEYRIWSKER